MGRSGLYFVIGGKSLGKTKIAKTIVDNAGPRPEAQMGADSGPAFLASWPRLWPTHSLPALA